MNSFSTATYYKVIYGREIKSIVSFKTSPAPFLRSPRIFEEKEDNSDILNLTDL